MLRGIIIKKIVTMHSVDDLVLQFLGSVGATVVPLDDKRMSCLGALSIFWRR